MFAMCSLLSQTRPTSTITFTDTSDDAGSYSSSTNTVDGFIDNISVRQSGGQLGTTAFTEGGASVVLDNDTTLFDAEIDAALDDFDGTTLTLARNGGANSDDVFSASGLLERTDRERQPGLQQFDRWNSDDQ